MFTATLSRYRGVVWAPVGFTVRPAGDPMICTPPPEVTCFFPSVNEYPKLADEFQLPLVRAELRPTPAGRSLNTRSPLSSIPVRMVSGDADDPPNPSRALRLRSALLVIATWPLCRRSCP